MAKTNSKTKKTTTTKRAKAGVSVHRLGTKTARSSRRLAANLTSPVAHQVIDEAVASLNAITVNTPADVKAQVIDKAVATVKKANAKAEPKPKAEPKLLSPSEVSAARKEGMRLFILAGRPKKDDFLKVYGEKGDRWTWEQRAKAAGLATAEEAAKRFPKMFAAKAAKND